ncbi:MAG: hypothetical protein M3O46_03785, partial [Myxococcota bacterium]|nr:hypothetical protein [Myxococcota bacterium]
MTKPLLSSMALAFALTIPAVSAAQSAPSGGGGSCPPGSWFCAESPQQRATPAGQPVTPLQPLPDPEARSTSEDPQSSDATQKHPAVVYRSPPPAIIVRPEAPPPYEYARPPRLSISRPSEWGLNLHLEGAMIGSGARGNAGLGGGGGG